jgi:indole-3-glycerol phosphate synthase
MILEEIVDNTRIELEIRKQDTPLTVLQKMAQACSQPIDLASSLAGQTVKLIAEVKKASPSRGVLRTDFNPVQIANIYASNGASAISVLTDYKYFMGRLEYLTQINSALGQNRPPLLRKDFIFDPYQIYESRACGADALLLIAAILTPEKLAELLELSHTLQMRCLVEAHNEEDIKKALESGAKIIGINNRDLRTFKVDLETTARLRSLIPDGRIVVSESGIKNRSDIQKLHNLRVNAVLVGETLVASTDIAAAIRKLL